MAAEVVDTSSNVSDIVFPKSPSQLDNFTSVDLNDTVQIIIPGSALTTLANGSGRLHNHHFICEHAKN